MEPSLDFLKLEDRLLHGGEDLHLRRAVEQMLHDAERADAFFDAPLEAAAARVPREGPGTSFGGSGYGISWRPDLLSDQLRGCGQACCVSWAPAGVPCRAAS